MLVSLVVCGFSACSDDDDDYDKDWKAANDAAYGKIAVNPEYKEVRMDGAPRGVFYKVLQAGTGTQKPYETSTVKVLYRGLYYNLEDVFDEGGTSQYGESVTWTLSSLDVRGLTLALQNMVVGDKWEIWIPYNLAYGGYTYGGIPAYSTLVFEVELVEIIL